MEIQDYPNYLVYDDGRVFSKKRNKFLKPGKNSDGYYLVILHQNGKPKSFKNHRLVGLHYLPLVEGKDCIDHIDGDKLNNHVNNLRWTTQQENLNNYKKLRKDNTSGLKNISPYQNGFQFRKNIFGKRYQKFHKNLNEILWYKFVFLMINNS
jgi:hypothetical protein